MKKIFVLLITITILFSCGKNTEEQTVKSDEKVINNTETIEPKKVVYTSFYPIHFLTKSLL